MTTPARSSEPVGIEIVCPIRWGDLDMLGHVNNTIFFQFCESARIAYFEALDMMRFRRHASEGPGLVSANLNFRRQLRYPGTVRVSANATAVGERSFTLSYVIRDISPGLEVEAPVAADGGSVCVWVDYAAGKALRLPDELVARLAELERNPVLRRGEN